MSRLQDLHEQLDYSAKLSAGEVLLKDYPIEQIHPWPKRRPRGTLRLQSEPQIVWKIYDSFMTADLIRPRTPGQAPTSPGKLDLTRRRSRAAWRPRSTDRCRR